MKKILLFLIKLIALIHSGFFLYVATELNEVLNVKVEGHNHFTVLDFYKRGSSIEASFSSYELLNNQSLKAAINLKVQKNFLTISKLNLKVFASNAFFKTKSQKTNQIRAPTLTS